MDGSPWVTEKDGIAAVLLMMESIARTGLDITAQYARLAARFGPHHYERVDMPAEPAHKARLLALAADPAEVGRRLGAKQVAGRSIVRTVVGDGIKVVLEGGVWVLKRPSGTEDIVKDYREERGRGLETARKASEELDGLLGLAG
jgi:phosphoglucomutase